MNETEKQDSINANYEYNALLAEVQAFRQKALEANRAIELLVLAGHVSQERVDQAQALAQS